MGYSEEGPVRRKKRVLEVKSTNNHDGFCTLFPSLYILYPFFPLDISFDLIVAARTLSPPGSTKHASLPLSLRWAMLRVKEGLVAVKS